MDPLHSLFHNQASTAGLGSSLPPSASASRLESTHSLQQPSGAGIAAVGDTPAATALSQDVQGPGAHADNSLFATSSQAKAASRILGGDASAVLIRGEAPAASDQALKVPETSHSDGAKSLTRLHDTASHFLLPGAATASSSTLGDPSSPWQEHRVDTDPPQPSSVECVSGVAQIPDGRNSKAASEPAPGLEAPEHPREAGEPTPGPGGHGEGETSEGSFDQTAERVTALNEQAGKILGLAEKALPKVRETLGEARTLLTDLGALTSGSLERPPGTDRASATPPAPSGTAETATPAGRSASSSPAVSPAEPSTVHPLDTPHGVSTQASSLGEAVSEAAVHGEHAVGRVETVLHGASKVIAPAAVIGGSLALARGAHELREGHLTEGSANVVGGSASVVGGAAETTMAYKAALKASPKLGRLASEGALEVAEKLAMRAGGIAALAEGGKDVVAGYREKNTEKMAVGGLKTAAGALMFSPTTAPAGIALYVGVTVYDNRHEIAAAAHSVSEGVHSIAGKASSKLGEVYHAGSTQAQTLLQGLKARASEVGAAAQESLAKAGARGSSLFG